MKTLTLIDMNLGNLQSIIQAFKRIGIAVEVTDKKEDILQAQAVILPGVGAFADGMANLLKNNLVEALRHHVVAAKKPLLGICLGMQLLAETSQEHGMHQGLNFIKGCVKLLNPTLDGYRVPNMGWCDVKIKRRGGAFSNITDGETFYFAHSYYFECSDHEDIVAVIEFSGQEITCAVEKENIVGVQFHPEKSQDVGLDFLDSFVKLI